MFISFCLKAINVPQDASYEYIVRRLEELDDLKRNSLEKMQDCDIRIRPLQMMMDELSQSYFKKYNQDQLLLQLDADFGENYWAMGHCFRLVHEVVNNKTKLSSDQVVKKMKGTFLDHVKVDCAKIFRNYKYFISLDLFKKADRRANKSDLTGAAEETPDSATEEETYGMTKPTESTPVHQIQKKEPEIQISDNSEEFVDVIIEEFHVISESEEDANTTNPMVQSEGMKKPAIRLCDEFLANRLNASARSMAEKKRKKFSADMFMPKTVPREQPKIKLIEPHFITPKRRKKN